MRDFDSEREKRIAERQARWEEEGRDRSFKLGGEVFEYRTTIPFSVLDDLDRIRDTEDDMTLTKFLSGALVDCIEPGEDGQALARLQKARHLIEYADVEEAVFWIVAEHARRPTQASSPSGDGRETTGETSTDDSSSTVAARSTS